MGGAQAGDVASGIAVETLTGGYYAAATATPEDALREAISTANRRVLEVAAQLSSQNGMGSTCVCIALRGTHIAVANLGDSRAYILRGERFVQLSQDHSWIAEQVRSGIMTEQDARTSQFRNVITQALGAGEVVNPSVRGQELRKGDVLLLCSDGLTTMLEDREIAAFLSQYDDPQEVCDALTDAANQRGGKDNIAIIVVRIDDLDQPTAGLATLDEAAPEPERDSTAALLQDHAADNPPSSVATLPTSDRAATGTHPRTTGRLNVPPTGPATAANRLTNASRMTVAASERRPVNLRRIRLTVLLGCALGLVALWLMFGLQLSGAANYPLISIALFAVLVVVVAVAALAPARKPPVIDPVSHYPEPAGAKADNKAADLPMAAEPATIVSEATADPNPRSQPPLSSLELRFPFGDKEHDVQPVRDAEDNVRGSVILNAPARLLGSEDELATTATRGFWLTLYERSSGESSVAILLSPRAYSEEWSIVTAELPQDPRVRFADIKTIRPGLDFTLSVGKLTASVTVADCHYVIAGRQRTPDRYLDQLTLGCVVTVG